MLLLFRIQAATTHTTTIPPLCLIKMGNRECVGDVGKSRDGLRSLTVKLSELVNLIHEALIYALKSKNLVG